MIILQDNFSRYMLLLHSFMDNHPIPQDVAGFQFKLIGDMTIKQFAYLASGVVIGWLFLSLPVTAFIKLPITAFFILLGIGFAFMPIAGRPIDVMITNFIKSLFSPTQYVYIKTSGDSFLPEEKVINLQTPLKTQPKNLQDAKVEFLKPEPSIMDKPPLSHHGPYMITVEEPIDKLQEQEQEQQEEKAEEEPLEKEPDKNIPSSFDLHQKVLDLEEQLQETLAQKEQLAQQIIDLQKKLNLQNKNLFATSLQGPKTPTQNIKTVPRNTTRNAGSGVPTPDVPNVVTGIVTDPRGNPLSNILVEIKDKEGNPVRAFKTSLLGQFASATPLPNGVYAIEFEDLKEQNKFDTIELNVTGEIIMPIEIKSIDKREDLRRSLFGVKTN